MALCQHEDLLIHRFELLYQQQFESLARLVGEDIHAVSPETEVCQRAISLRDPWDFEEVYGGLHEFARQYRFVPEKEEYLIHITTGTHVAQICMFLLTEARYFPGKIVQASPPSRRNANSPGEYRIIDLDLSIYDRIASRFQREQLEGLSFLKSGIDTRNKAFNELIEQIERVAIHSKAPILLIGPTGSGKSRLARRIYELKKARHQLLGSFVEVNCATLRGDAAMSALFGHVKGAFTGAAQDRPGLLRAAEGGILFLDEIGELGLDEQAMLLRALEEKRFLPMGADREAKSDFHLIGGTNRDLVLEVQKGRFREDLLARINLWTFRLPALRERPEDIEPNLEYELDQFASSMGTQITFSKEARERFLLFATSRDGRWKANFRDLNAAINRMATLTAGGRITVPVVNEEIERLKEFWKESRAGNVEDDPLAHVLGEPRAATLDHFDRVQLAEAVRICQKSHTLSEAGRILFSSSRQRKRTMNDADRLRKYLARFGLTWEAVHQRQ